MLGFQLADYYDPKNVDGVRSRDAIASACLDAAIDFLDTESGMVRRGFVLSCRKVF